MKVKFSKLISSLPFSLQASISVKQVILILFSTFITFLPTHFANLIPHFPASHGFLPYPWKNRGIYLFFLNTDKNQSVFRFGVQQGWLLVKTKCDAVVKECLLLKIMQMVNRHMKWTSFVCTGTGCGTYFNCNTSRTSTSQIWLSHNFQRHCKEPSVFSLHNKERIN